MATRLLAMVICATVFSSLAGCESVVQGFIYTHTSQPLTTNFHKTPVDGHDGKLDTKRISLRLEVAWDSNSIGDIAESHHFDEIYYADIETLSILTVWHQQWVHIYGK